MFFEKIRIQEEEKKERRHAHLAEDEDQEEEEEEGPQRKQEREEYAEEYVVFSTLSWSVTLGEDTWIIDSGASKHMMGQKKILSKLE